MNELTTNLKMRQIQLIFFAILLALILIDLTAGLAHAEGLQSVSQQSNLFDWGSATSGGSGPGLNEEIKKILVTLENAAKAISVIMTVVAGAMVCLNLQDGRKVIWNYILGIGLAINFGAFLLTLFGNSGSMTASVTVTQIDNSQLEDMVKLKTQGNSDILSTFMAYFSSVLFANTDTVLKPIAFRLTIILAAIDASVKLAMDLISGDKVRFMVTTCLKVGFYLFLIDEWLKIAPAVAVWFQNMGFMLGGSDPASAGSFHADSIVDNAITMVNTLVGAAAAGGDKTSGAGAMVHRVVNGFLNTISGAVILQIIIMAGIVIALILTAIEMFMARIEFYMMMAISTILLPFGVIDKLNFLAKGAISSIFNTGAKVMIIAFIQAISTALLAKYVEQYVEAQGTTFGPNFPLLLQMLLLSLVILIITKKVPQLAQGFLNGQPALDGGSMKDLAMKTAKTAGDAAKAVATHGASLSGRLAGGMAKAYGDTKLENPGIEGKALAMSTLKGGAKNFAQGLGLEMMAKNPVSNAIGGAFADGMRASVGREGTMSYVGKGHKLFGEKAPKGTEVLGSSVLGSLVHHGKTSAIGEYAAKKATDWASGENPFKLMNKFASGTHKSQQKPLTADQVEQEKNQQGSVDTPTGNDPGKKPPQPTTTNEKVDSGAHEESDSKKKPSGKLKK